MSLYWESFFPLLWLPLTIVTGTILIIIIGIGVIMPTVPATILSATGTLILGGIDTSATAESIPTIITGTEDIGMTKTSGPREEYV